MGARGIIAWLLPVAPVMALVCCEGGSKETGSASACAPDQTLAACPVAFGGLCLPGDAGPAGCDPNALPSGMSCTGDQQCTIGILPCPGEFDTWTGTGLVDGYVCSCVDGQWSCDDCAPGAALCAPWLGADAVACPPEDVDASDGTDARTTAESGDCVSSLEIGADGGCGGLDVRMDPHNCGECGHDCAGGACQAGVCVPLPPNVLATGLRAPIAIAVDSVNAYWLELGNVGGGGGKLGNWYVDGQVKKCAIGGCNNDPTILAAGLGQGGMYPPPAGIAVDGESVYFSAGGAVLSCAISGCACQPTVRMPSIGASAITVACTGIYASEYANDTIAFCPPGGCPSAGPERFGGSIGGPLGITHDAANVYWIDINGELRGCPLGGCGQLGPVTLNNPTYAGSQAVAVDSENLYWTNGNPAGSGSVQQCRKTDCPATVTTLASGRNAPLGIAVDATDVYWVEGGNVYRCAIGGCGGAPAIATTTEGPAIAVDATHIYVAQGPQVPQDASSAVYGSPSLVAVPK